MLSLLIASPLCCCTWLSHGKAAVTERACCHAKDKPQKSKPPDSRNCRCAQTPKVRDLAATTVKAPLREGAGSPLDLPFVERLAPTRRDVPAGTRVTLNEHAPPGWPVPLFVRHCALLC